MCKIQVVQRSDESDRSDGSDSRQWLFPGPGRDKIVHNLWKTG
jgi:hypothetical protein